MTVRVICIHMICVFTCVAESNLEMKEENQILKEQDMIRNEQLQQYEKKIDTLEVEVSIHLSLIY